ncbi:hypothetical protein LSH36_739g01001 [Paralvinella palmiformis]|uniref:Phosphodiesterase n=1 Tax=Paralvinella palmiformis TaxID=53620 RepID=A0AAD9J150_9ANNE|nr:hypothetical protein LSH36_739g01001 [Paralvinella palmiformis]
MLLSISRRLCDEDDELSEVEPDAVPSEVRDWLALTFTRSMSNIKRRGNDKPKFRSVAHAIRAGIMVDRIYRRMSSTVGLHIPPDVLLILKNLDEWSFDVFSVNEAGDNHALKYVAYELLQRYDLIAKFKINTQILESFLIKLEEGYSKYKNPYHNLVHAADVTQTTHHIVSQSGLALWLTDLELLAVLVAAMVHDYEHTGTTNTFHINTSSEVALIYNDRAVLESHHVSAAFRFMREDDYNILSGLKKEEYRDFRSLVIDIVLATDMSFHFQQIKNMKNLLSMPENIDKAKALSLIVHCADISHPAKEWNLHYRWTSQLIEEFFLQGDREADLGLPISPLCDRKTTMIAESQIGFIDFIVDPSFQVMGDMMEKIVMPLHHRNTGITEESFDNHADKATSTTSLSSRSSTPLTPKSLSPATVKFEVKRYWMDCLLANKAQWKERAAKELEAKNKQMEERAREMEKVTLDLSHVKDAAQKAAANNEQKSDEQQDSGVESPNSKDAGAGSREKTDVGTDTVVEVARDSSQRGDQSTSSSSSVPTPQGVSRQTSTTGLLDFAHKSSTSLKSCDTTSCRGISPNSREHLSFNKPTGPSPSRISSSSSSSLLSSPLSKPLSAAHKVDGLGDGAANSQFSNNASIRSADSVKSCDQRRSHDRIKSHDSG